MIQAETHICKYWLYQNKPVIDVFIRVEKFFITFKNVYAPEEDPNMKIEHYARSYEQNESLGLNDMKTENYA
jgi:hypothetical protein